MRHRDHVLAVFTALIGLAGSPGTVGATDVTPGMSSVVAQPAPLTPTLQAHNCQCRAHGRLFEQGELTCIRGVIARCSMALNNSSWEFTASACTQSARPGVRVAIR